MAIGILRQADGAGLGNTFKTRGDIDAVTHQIAVALLDYIAQMDADAEVDPALRREASVPLRHAVLNFNGTAHCIDHAAELDQGSIASALHHAPVMHGNGRVDEITPQCTQPSQRAILIGTSEAA